jgi:alanine racemase
MTPRATSVLQINLQAYRHNIRTLQSIFLSNTGIIAVVKSNGYGLGAVELAKRALEEGVAMLAVAHVVEGEELREQLPDVPILVMVQPLPDELTNAVKANLTITLSELTLAEKLGDIARKLNKVVPVHCEIDTGMGRQGFSIEDAPKALLKMTRISNIDVQAIYTHFPSADSRNDNFTANQIKAFNSLINDLSKDGIPFEYVHAANSAAVLMQEGCAYDYIRPGIITYGVWPNNQPDKSIDIKPIMEWKTKVVLIRDLPGGVPISYGRTFRTDKPTKIAVLPIGYADGYPRILSNQSDVLIRGTRCPIRGTITMNETMVDITHIPETTIGETVTLIGTDAHETISVEELAEKAQTIGYEILTGISEHIPRQYSS